MDYEDRIQYFKAELDLIARPEIREFVKECMKAVPDYIFEDCPSSYGPYHPIEELGPDGTILHTKEVFALAYELSRGLDCEESRDEICAAALLHDLLKQGESKSGYTTKDHPQLMADLVADIYRKKFRNKLDRESALKIYYGIFYHYGPWTKPDSRKPITQYTMEELAVYLADYISSKRFVHIDSRRKLEGV